MPQAGMTVDGGAAAQLQGQTAGGFLGVNLRRDRVTLADQDMARAINADMHSQPGAIVLRLGRTKQFTTALADLIVRRIAKINTQHYQVAGQSLYRNQVNVANGLLSGNLVTTLVPYRPFNDTVTWAFVADDALMQKDNGTVLRKWGIAAPALPPTASTNAGGTLTGTYSARYTYVRKVAGALVAESNPSPSSQAVVLASQALALTDFAAPNDPQVTHYRIYRTTSSNSVFLMDQDVGTASTSAVSSQADTALGNAVDLTGNTPPPLASFAEVFQDSIFLCRDAANPHYLWYSKRFQVDSFPTNQFLEIGNPDDPLQCCVAGPGILGVFTKRTKYRVTGNIQSGFEYQQSFSQRGTLAYNAVIGSPLGLIFPGTDGVFLTNMLSADLNFAQDILPIFAGETMNGMLPINWNAASVMASGVFKERYYLSYPSGASVVPDKLAVYSWYTKKWYHYDHPLQSFFYETDTDQFTAGGLDGFVYVLESGTSDGGTAITLTVDTKDFQIMGPAALPMRRLFLWVKIDADTLGDTLNVDLYVDDDLEATFAFANNGRTTKLLPCPQGTTGFRWRMVFRYTGTNRIRIYDGSTVYLPLLAA